MSNVRLGANLLHSDLGAPKDALSKCIAVYCRVATSEQLPSYELQRNWYFTQIENHPDSDMTSIQREEQLNHV